MSENRKQILDMLAAGKITADEAERLIAALERAPGGDSAGAPTRESPCRNICASWWKRKTITVRTR
jgi:hypothetical protein